MCVGLTTEGLFRVSGSALRVKELIAELDSGNIIIFPNHIAQVQILHYRGGGKSSQI